MNLIFSLIILTNLGTLMNVENDMYNDISRIRYIVIIEEIIVSTIC